MHICEYLAKLCSEYKLPKEENVDGLIELTMALVL